MRRSLCSLRKSAVVFIGVMSVIFAVFLVWHLVTPGRIGQVASLELLAVLALFVLPGATAAAWELDRRTVRSRRVDEVEVEPQVRLHGPQSGRGAPAHRHRVAPNSTGAAARVS
jgi:hypothetical protein